MKIWLDITNAPHVPFFKPVINELKRRGHELVITAREYSQTIDLLNTSAIPYQIFGRHGGASMIGKTRALLGRSCKLLPFIARQRVDVAVSHGSNDMALVAWLLRIPSMIMFDYEYATLTHRFNFRLVNKIVFSDIIPDALLFANGARPQQIHKYPGLKEAISMSSVEIIPNYLEQFKIDTNKIIVTLRTPAEMSAYHRFENLLFVDILKRLVRRSDLFLVVLSRNHEQRNQLQKQLVDQQNLWFPVQALDGANLIYHSDLVIGAGGTMNREAVYLGTPVYTIFKGKLGAIDEYLINAGKLQQITKIDDLDRIPLVKKGHRSLSIDIHNPTLEFVLNQILTL